MGGLEDSGDGGWDRQGEEWGGEIWGGMEEVVGSLGVFWGWIGLCSLTSCFQ